MLKQCTGRPSCEYQLMPPGDREILKVGRCVLYHNDSLEKQRQAATRQGYQITSCNYVENPGCFDTLGYVIFQARTVH